MVPYTWHNPIHRGTEGKGIPNMTYVGMSRQYVHVGAFHAPVRT